MNKPSVTALDHLVLTVRDLDATVRFYESVLGCTSLWLTPADGSKRCALAFGSQKINLHVAGQEFEPKAALPAPGSADLCFLTDHSVADWQAHLATLGIPILEGPVQRIGATKPILSLYLRDPDGNLVEIGTTELDV